MACAAGAEVVLALAPPVAASEGGYGSGSTPFTAVPPVLRTRIVRVKVWPRLIVVGTASSETNMLGASTCALLLTTLGATTGASVLASLPRAPADSVKLPVPLAV